MSNTISHTAEHEHRDDFGAKLGMWIFLFTEIFFFGGLFLVYSVYRSMHPAEFHEASLHLNTFIGALNSALLLFSSMTISMAITALHKGNVNLSKLLIAITLLLAVVFMVNKLIEWDHKLEIGLVPGSELMLGLKSGYVLFFSLYFFMTGLHAVHIIVGIVLMTICYRRVSSGRIHADSNMLLVNSALYWHLVDLVWIFLFPLLYLIN